MTEPIKPIETVYSGYRFRSRLEARWAVFFNALNIPYEYEKEGFDLGGGVWYLPDFWLPTENCWIEIKPEHAPPQAREKVELFATQLIERHMAAYDVYLQRSGPRHPLAVRLRTEGKAFEAWIEMMDTEIRQAPDTDPAFLEQQSVLRHIFMDLYDHAQTLFDVAERIDGAPPSCPDVYLCEGQPFVSAGVPEYRLLTLGYGEVAEAPQWWATWADGNEVAIRAGKHSHLDHPRLRAAYAAARGARFEHGEHGGR